MSGKQIKLFSAGSVRGRVKTVETTNWTSPAAAAACGSQAIETSSDWESRGVE
jgi:hypothetical protein